MMRAPLTFAIAMIPALLLRGAATQGPPPHDGIEAYVASQMVAQHIPGLSFAVIRNGVLADSGARGLANVELQAPVTADTEFAIASMSKSVTASAILLLAQEGKLSIDDRVRKYVPGVPATWDAMTIRQLLSHTAGVKDHFSDSPIYPRLQIDRRLSYSDEEYLEAHTDAPLNFPPGTEFSYSGGGYVILGAIIARVTGAPYGDYLRERIFRPLGMPHTHLISLTDIIPNRAAGYWFREGALRNGGYTGQAHIGGPDVGVMTTATDLSKWLIAVTSGALLTAASRDAMWTPALLADGREAVAFPAAGNYGLGWSIHTYRGYRMFGHGGSLVNGFMSTFFVIRERQIAVIVLTNQYDANPQSIALGIAALYDPQLTPPSEMRVTADADTPSTARVQSFFDAIFHGGDVMPFATPGLARHLSAMWHPPDAAQMPPAPLTFIARENATRPLECFGAAVSRFAYYKVHVDGDDHWFTVMLTADGRIANYEAY